MPIPVTDRTESEAGLAAAYLKFVEHDSDGIRAALFIVTARGEPLEFVFNSISVPAHFLWRSGEVRRAAVRTLCQSMFQAATRVPDLVLALAEEVPARVFTQDLAVSIPLCRIAGAQAVTSADEIEETLPSDLHIFWATPSPAPESNARSLLEALSLGEGLLEPFDRAATGITEAFREL